VPPRLSIWRMAIAETAGWFRVAIVEDDPYGFLPTDGPLPFAALAPDITWHVSGLAKCLARSRGQARCR